jgi:two-component system alkaline phosphatase synthesis response regulator PhoP
MATILVAEDEPDISNLIALTLKFGGFEVISTSNGVDAVAHAKEDDPDLIILDVRMPRMTGYEACRRLKADESTAGIPVVFLSARGQENEVKAGLEAGGVDYILKPFAPDKLIERVGELLNSHAPEAAASKPATEKAASPAGKPAAGERSEAGADEKEKKSGEEAEKPTSAASSTGPGAGSPIAKKPGERANGSEQPKQVDKKEQVEAKAEEKPDPDEAQAKEAKEAKDGKAES